jgi:hypothetical protein
VPLQTYCRGVVQGLMEAILRQEFEQALRSKLAPLAQTQ